MIVQLIDRSKMSTAAGLVTLLMLVAVAGCSEAADSTLFQDVSIIDGTGAAAFSGSVRVSGDRIVEVGDLTTRRGETVVVGAGLVLAPGFIDTHSHHDRGLLDERRSARAVVSQGSTTVIVGQDGGSPGYPLADFFDQAEVTPPAVNVASYTGHGMLRETVMGDDFLRPATPAEIDSMAVLLAADMRGGSLGLSTGLEYQRSVKSTTDEVVFLARVASESGGRYISHIRSEDRGAFEAIDELLRIGAEADIPVQVSHMKLAMTSLWGRSGELIETLDAARARGVDVTADVYPYTYWQSTMTVLVPNGDFSREAVEFALRELATPGEIVFGRFTPEPSYIGLTLEEIAEVRGEDVVTAFQALLEMAHGAGAPPDARESIVARSMAEEDIRRLYQWEHTNVGSDGGPAGAHPRGYGAFPRMLRIYIQEEGTLTLEDGVHRMTSLSADHMGISDRGVIREGAFADLVLFDPATVTDHAEIGDPYVLSTGIEGVWVNGIQVWGGDISAPPAYPGRVLRREGE